MNDWTIRNLKCLIGNLQEKICKGQLAICKKICKGQLAICKKNMQRTISNLQKKYAKDN